MPTTTVVLRGVRSLSIHVDEFAEEIQRTGIMVARRGPAVTLIEGENEVETEFWKQWFQQNQQTSLVKGHFVFERNPS
jgi:hypothetical protein